MEPSPLMASDHFLCILSTGTLKIKEILKSNSSSEKKIEEITQVIDECYNINNLRYKYTSVPKCCLVDNKRLSLWQQFRLILASLFRSKHNLY